jgi:flagellar M-ring protein FliF
VADQATGTTELATKGGLSAGNAMAAVTRVREVWSAMPSRKRSKLIGCAAVLAAAFALVSWWGTRTEWKTLYSGMEGRDLEQVQGELAAAGISYQATPDGLGVQVPAELLDKARMEVAAKGMPQSGRMGFELFDKPNWVGSEFDEKVNYQRALEGELEHTIATLGSVRSARVHLVLPKESLYSEQQQPAKASVVLKLKRATLAKEEVESVRNLVAGAVEGLTPEQVTLVDADGKANLNAPGASMQASDEEQALAEKLVSMLEPLAGAENVRATVNIAYDQSSEERTDEVVDPTLVAPLSTQKTSQSSGAVAKAAGIPGTASNTPGVDANGKASLPVYPSAAPQQQNAQEESSTFAVTRHTTHEEVGPGRVARITAAVLMNDRAMTEGAGKGQHTVWRPRTVDEMKRLEELAQAAVGFDPKRGDSVVLQNIAFSANAPEPAVPAMARATDEVQSLLRAQPELLRMAAAALAAVMLVMLVVRPVAKQAMVLLSEPRQLAGDERGYAASLGAGQATEGLERGQGLPNLQAGSAGHNGAADDEDDMLPAKKKRRRAVIDDDGVLEYVAAHIRREPAQSTRLLEAWIGTRERVS